MSTSKGKKKNFWHPDMLREESSSSNDSTSFNHNHPLITNRNQLPSTSFWHSNIPSNSSPIACVNHSSHPQRRSHKKSKFWHPDMLREETTSSSSNESNSLDQTDQFGGQTSPIPGPSYPETEPLPGPASIQQTQQDQFIPTVPALPQDTTDPRPGPSGIQQSNAETLPPDDSGWYEEETKVFENENFTVFIQKQDHQRQKVFRLDDHLFVLRIKLKNHKKPPLLSSIRDIIESTMTVMVDDLKNHYNPNESNLIYVTLKQPGMQNALRSGGFNLQMSQTSSILSFVMNMFNRFINSNEEVKLDQGFQVYFKIFSYNHLNWPKSRRKQNPRTLGCQQETEILKIAGCVNIPSGFPGQEIFFKNKCLLTSTIVCFYANQYFLNNKNDESFEKLKPLWTKGSPRYKKLQAGNFLQLEILKLVETLQLKHDGPYDITATMPLLCDYFSSQIHLIKSTQEDIATIQSFPTPEWKNELLQIFLLGTEPGHVVPIINLKQYVNQNNQLCLICKKTFQRYYRHFCSFKEYSCFLCKSYYAKDSTIVQKNLPFKYCFSKLEPKLPTPLVCDICNYKFATKQCFENHKSACGVRSKQGRIGYFCDQCNKFIKGANSIATKRDHKCFTSLQTKCKHCNEICEKDTDHQCLLSKEKLTKNWPKLVFFSFEFQSNSTFKCTTCQQMRRQFKEDHGLTWKEAYSHKEFASLKCIHHQRSTLLHTPNCCTVWKETASGLFDEICFADDELNLQNEVTSNIFYLNYDLHGKSESTHQKSFGKQTQATKSSLKQIINKEKKTVMDYFTMFLLSPEVRNYTFLSLNNCNENMATVMSCLLKLNWSPNLIKKTNTFVLLHTKCQNLLFLNASNYFKGDYVDLAQQFCLDENPQFFPQR
jgi:hypothetical protein